ncbi:sigma factor-like helix-turn-helix DNA-binding protein [Clostridium intestinale]|uniref:sigma factor-like helix-turn-helix DNA-binding protein n=1 Tax=Clostridium intestinale TaxID=36845 RepID=UPI002DD67AD1|nr:sigma factor-like helix-turn-helix DNA-binding protein [Clostridium intestinale]WRY53958.1 sigma factor-like helix-turn-helix DNA-binding protein [Clostridium intestinale]
MKELKEKDKEIFIRRYLLDESMEKISKDLNLSKEYIYNKLSRGRKKIKERLEGI